MLRGVYASACGMMTQAAREDLLAANVANLDTLGYRRLETDTRSFPSLLAASAAGSGALDLGSTLSPTVIDTSPGPVETTGNPLDFALVGSGYFAVAGAGGQVLYTRAGRFTLKANRQLVTPDGQAVLGQKGPITLPPGKVAVAEDGTVSVDGKAVDRLRLVSFANSSSLSPMGNGLLSASGPGQPATGVRVMQGEVENSNVEIAPEMTRMIAALRSYEANVTAMRTQDEALGRLISAVS